MKCGPVLYGIPARNVAEVIAARDVELLTGAGLSEIRHREEVIPLLVIERDLGNRQPDEERFTPILQTGSARVAFSAPLLLGDYELVRHPAIEFSPRRTSMSSATLNDGRLVLLLAVAGSISQGRACPRGGLEEALGGAPKAPDPDRRRLADIRELIAELVRSDGLDPSPVADGPTALALLRDSQVDAAVLDVDMPVMKWVRASSPNAANLKAATECHAHHARVSR